MGLNYELKCDLIVLYYVFNRINCELLWCSSDFFVFLILLFIIGYNGVNFIKND